MRGRNLPLALSIHSDGRLRAHSWYLVPHNVCHARIRMIFIETILEIDNLIEKVNRIFMIKCKRFDVSFEIKIYFLHE